MSERVPENFDSRNEGDSVVGDGVLLEPQNFEGGFSKYEMPTSYMINGVEVSVEDLRTLAVSELANDPKMANVSPEDKDIFGDILADVAEMAHIAQIAPQTPEIAKEGKAKELSIRSADVAVANAFFASPEEEEQIKEAQEIIAESGGAGSSLVNWVNTKGKKLLATAALAIGASAMPQMASARGGDFRGFVSPQVAQRAEQGVNAMDRINVINKRQQDISIEIQRLDRQKAVIAQRSAGQGEVAGLGNQYENRARVRGNEARYEAGLKQIEAKKLEAEARFSKKANPTEADRMKHEARLKKIDARAARIEGAYDVAQAREEGRHVVRHNQIRNESWNTYSTIADIEAQQQRLMTEQNLLQQEKGSILFRTGINVFRR